MKDIKIYIEAEGKMIKEMWFKKLDEEVIETLEDFLDELSDGELHKNDGEK